MSSRNLAAIIMLVHISQSYWRIYDFIRQEWKEDKRHDRFCRFWVGTFLSFSLMFCHCEPSILPTSPKEMLGLSLVMFSRWALQKNMYGASARLGRQPPPLVRFITKPLGLVGAALPRPREDEALATGTLRLLPRVEARALAIVADLLINKCLQTTN